MANKVEQLELSFVLNAQSVEQAGGALRTEIEKGLGGVNFDSLRRNAATTSKQIGDDLKKALNQKLTVDTSSLDKSLSKYQSQRMKVERNLAAEVGKGAKAQGKGQASLDAKRLRELRKLIKEERKLFRERAKSMVMMNREAKAYLATMMQAQKRGGGGTPGGGFGASALPEVPARAARTGKAPKGKGKSGGLMKRMMGGMGRGGGQALAKAGPMLGKAAAGMGKAAAALGVAAVAIGATVGVLAGLLAVMMAADTAAKDMNKTLLSSAGAADMIGASYGGVSDQINTMREAAVYAQFSLKSLAKENIEILKTLHEHGVTIREMTQDVTDANAAMANYTHAMGLVLQTSRMIGESASTVAQNMATTSEELGLTLEGVAKRFSTIGRFAMESGFSTKRFYSMVIQATSGMSMYNVRLEEASGLLVRIGKILGQKTGGEFLQSLTKGFVNESMTARLKRTMLAGTGNTKKVFEASAQSTADAFSRDLTENAVDKSGKAITLDMKKMTGGKFSGNMVDMSGKELRQVLNKMTPEEQTKFMAKFSQELAKSNSQNADMLRQRLQTLIDVNKGSQGGLLNMARELGSLDMGGKLNMLRKSMASMFPGKEIHELSTKQLAALESATGMSGEQLHNMRRLTRGLEGNFKVLQDEAKKKGDVSKEDQISQIKQFGAYVKKNADGTKSIVQAALDEDGNIQDAIGSDGKPIVIKDMDKYVQSQGKRIGDLEAAKNFNEDRSISQEIANNTWSMADMLKAGISIVLEKIYGVVRAILMMMPGQKEYKQAIAVQNEQYNKSKESQEKANEIDKKIVEKEKELAKATDSGQKDALKKELTTLNLQKQQYQAGAEIYRLNAESVFDHTGDLSNKGKAANKIGIDNTFLGAGFIQGAKIDTGSMFGEHVTEKMNTDSGSASAAKSILENPQALKRLEKVAPDYVRAMRAAHEGNATMSAAEKKKAQETQVTLAKGYDRVSEPVKRGTIDTSTFRGEEGLPQNSEKTGDFYTYNLAGTGGGNHPMTAESYAEFFLGFAAPANQRKTSLYAQNSDYGKVNPDFNLFNPKSYTDENSGVVATNEGRTSRTDPGILESTFGEGLVDVQAGQLDGKGNLVSDSKSGVILSTGGEAAQVQDVQVRGVMPSVENIARTEKTGYDVRNIYQQIMTAATDGGRIKPSAVLPKDAAKSPFRMIEGANDFGSQNQTMKDLLAEDASYITNPKNQTTNKFQGAVAGLQSGEGVGAGVSVNRAEGGESLIADFAELKKRLVTPEKKGGEGKSLEEANEILNKAIRESAKEEGGLTRDGFFKALEAQEPGLIERHRKAEEKRKKLVANTERLKRSLKDLPKDIGEALVKAQRESVARGLAGMVGVTDKKQVDSLVRGGKLGSGAGSVGLKLRNLLANEATPPEVKAVLRTGMGKLGLVQDFIYKGGSQGGTITPIHSGDEFLGMRDRGSVDNALVRNSRGGGVATINVNVYSNNLEEVKRAIYQAAEKVGVGGRMRSRAGRGYGSNKSGVV